MIRLDLDTHIYWLGKNQVPGYSQIVRDLGVVKPNPHYTEDGREEGRMLSEWLLFLAQGKVSSKEPVSRIEGRVEGIRKFLAQSRFKLMFGEVSQYDPSLNYACTPDVVGHLNGCLVNIDAKRGGKAKTHPLQLAAQRIALAANGIRVAKSFNLYLRNNDFRLVEQDTRPHEPRWRQFVSTWHLAKEYE